MSGGVDRKERELRVVREVATAVNGTLDLAEVLARILEAMRDNFGFRHAMVLLARPEGDLEVVASAGYPEKGLGVRVPVGAGPIGIVARRRKLMRMTSVQGKMRYAAASTAATGTATLPGLPDVDSMVVVPMMAHDALIGVFYVESNQPLTFGVEDERLVETVANLAAAAIRNASLFSELMGAHRAAERFVPHEFVRFLDKRALTELHRGEHVLKQMTVLFSDIRAFTSLVEGLDPAATFDLLNRYFAVTVPPIQRHHGFVDKFIGDAIMALFDESHVDAALDAAVTTHAALRAFNVERRAEGLVEIQMGVGLHTGPLTLGTVGSTERLSCTVYGDSVNLASRIEGLTRGYGAAVLVSEATVRALREPGRFSLRRLDRVRVKGKEEAVALYEVLDAWPDDVRATRAPESALADAWNVYAAGSFGNARDAFAALEQQWPADPVPRLFRERCARFLSAPPVGWDGAFRLESK